MIILPHARMTAVEQVVVVPAMFPILVMAGAMHPRITKAAALTVEIAANQPASIPLTNAAHGQASAAKTQALAKIPAVAIVMAIQAISVTAGATVQPTIQVVSGTVVIAASQRVAMEPTRVALWDTLATIQQLVKTPV